MATTTAKAAKERKSCDIAGMVPISSPVVACAGSGTKNPAAAVAGAGSHALALAAFLKRPQAEAQIGAGRKRNILDCGRQWGGLYIFHVLLMFCAAGAQCIRRQAHDEESRSVAQH